MGHWSISYKVRKCWIVTSLIVLLQPNGAVWRKYNHYGIFESNLNNAGNGVGDGDYDGDGDGHGDGDGDEYDYDIDDDRRRLPPPSLPQNTRQQIGSGQAGGDIALQ